MHKILLTCIVLLIAYGYYYPQIIQKKTEAHIAASNAAANEAAEDAASKIESLQNQLSALQSKTSQKEKGVYYRHRDGYYHLRGDVNGRAVNFIVDTGATGVALRETDARRAGFTLTASDFKYKSRTANGTAEIAVIPIDLIDVDGIRVYNVMGTVHRDDNLHVNLLGMSFLGRLKRFEMKNDKLILEQ